MGAAEREAPTAGDRPGGRIIPCAAAPLGAFANVYRDYRVMPPLQRGAIREPTSALAPGDGSVTVLLGMQRSSLSAPVVESALVRRMLLNQGHLEDKIVLNQRAMQFRPSCDFAFRQAHLLAMSG